MYAISPPLDTRRVFLVNEDISTFDQTRSFTVIWTASDMVDGTAEARFEEEESILSRRDMSIEGRGKGGC